QFGAQTDIFERFLFGKSLSLLGSRPLLNEQVQNIEWCLGEQVTRPNRFAGVCSVMLGASFSTFIFKPRIITSA
ncbi:MAG: hypothetical protein JXR44_03155, partial [Thiotrichales bacterium]|nr:hypothetical protein [Thiotrichales bacterium]